MLAVIPDAGDPLVVVMCIGVAHQPFSRMLPTKIHIRVGSLASVSSGSGIVCAGPPLDFSFKETLSAPLGTYKLGTQMHF